MENPPVKPRKRRRFESRVRRSFELFFLGIGLFVGLGVVGGCGAVSIFAVADDQRIPAAFLVIGIAALLIGVVYLATSMSRDVRILKEKLLEREDRNGGR